MSEIDLIVKEKYSKILNKRKEFLVLDHKWDTIISWLYFHRKDFTQEEQDKISAIDKCRFVLRNLIETDFGNENETKMCEHLEEAKKAFEESENFQKEIENKYKEYWEKKKKELDEEWNKDCKKYTAIEIIILTVFFGFCAFIVWFSTH